MSLEMSAFPFGKSIPSGYAIIFFKLSRIAFLLLSMLFVWNCPGNPLSIEMTTSYTPLDVGDIRQLVFHGDSSTTLMSVVGKTNRSDGTEVFIEEWKYGKQSVPFVSYYLVKDGYYMATELDTTSDDDINKAINPFGEQRLAKSHPVDGETWIHTLGRYDGAFWVSESIRKLNTLCGTFDNVFAFTLFEKPGSSILTTYYAGGVGYLGTSTSFFPGLDFSCSYIKVNGKVYGHLWPAKDPTIGPINEQENPIKMLAAYPFLIDQRILINGEM